MANYNIAKENNELIKSVREIFTIGNNSQFVIPIYQRGYKWDRDKVTKLLNDLYAYQESHKSNDGSFYCLQNITLVPSEGKYHVVDGQQRLTTLFVLLSYLKSFQPCDKLSFFYTYDCLRYDIRKETALFLQEDIYTGKIWDNEINPNAQSRKDQYYLADVAQGIKDWFSQDNHILKVATITDSLKLIVNNLENQKVSEEEIFAGLNGGKVDLDGSDLVRAELITRSAKEKFKNEVESSNAKVREFRQRIALELDEMNLWWSDKDHITYFEQFLPNNFSKKNIFNHKVYKIGLLYKLYYEIYHKDEEEFGIEFFENGRDLNNLPDDNHWELYSSLIDLHHTLQMWYNDSILYHWIGYLIFVFKQTTSFRDIWTMWRNATDKDDFMKSIITDIRAKLIGKKEGNTLDELLNDISDTKHQWYGDSFGMSRLLVLMDVMKCTGFYDDLWTDADIANRKIKSLQSIEISPYRLRPDYFQICEEDFEHVRSCAPNDAEGKEERKQQEWVDHINSNYPNEDPNTEEGKMKVALLKILEEYDKDELDDKTIARLNDEMNKYGQHSLGNLVLLDRGVNRSYKNAPFQQKIIRIFGEFVQGKKYIRPYTMIVFERKIADTDKSWRWAHANIKENVHNISSNVERFMKMPL